jgi:hypothetical protein
MNMINDMKYWNMYTRQLPKLWASNLDGDQLWLDPHYIRVVGHKHNLVALRWLHQIAYTYPDYTFVVASDSIDDLEELYFPSNVIPVLQVSKENDYKQDIKRYLKLCDERSVELPTLSIFCTDVFNVSKQIKWLLLAGTQYSAITDMLRVNGNHRTQPIPCYVEHFRYSKKLPNGITTRNLPNIPIKTFVDLETVVDGTVNCAKIVAI